MFRCLGVRPMVRDGVFGRLHDVVKRRLIMLIGHTLLLPTCDFPDRVTVLTDGLENEVVLCRVVWAHERNLAPAGSSSSLAGYVLLVAPKPAAASLNLRRP
jgi:hypothetical protein